MSLAVTCPSINNPLGKMYFVLGKKLLYDNLPFISLPIWVNVR